MTRDEAIIVLKDFNKQVTSKANGAYQSTIGKMACEVSVTALEEIKQYRALGTVKQIEDFIADWRKCRELGNLKELREAIEKQRAKKPRVTKYYYLCPNCRTRRSIKQKHKFCHDCGQAIDWSEE